MEKYLLMLVAMVAFFGLLLTGINVYTNNTAGQAISPSKDFNVKVNTDAPIYPQYNAVNAVDVVQYEFMVGTPPPSCPTQDYVEENIIVDMDYGSNNLMLITDRKPMENAPDGPGGYVWFIDSTSTFDRGCGPKLNAISTGEHGLTEAECNSQVCVFASKEPADDLNPFVHYVWPITGTSHRYQQGAYLPHPQDPLIITPYVISWSGPSNLNNPHLLLVDNYQDLNGDGELNNVFGSNSRINGIFRFNGHLYLYGGPNVNTCQIKEVESITSESTMVFGDIFPMNITNGPYQCSFPGTNPSIKPWFEIFAEKDGYLYFQSTTGELYRTNDLTNIQTIPYFSSFGTRYLPKGGSYHTRLKGIYNLGGVLYAVSVHSKVVLNNNNHTAEIADKVSVHRSYNGMSWQEISTVTRAGYPNANPTDDIVYKIINPNAVTNTPLALWGNYLYLATPAVTIIKESGFMIHSTVLYKIPHVPGQSAPQEKMMAD